MKYGRKKLEISLYTYSSNIFRYLER